MGIEPVVRSVQVNGAPERAFNLFTSRMGLWWPTGKTVAAAPHVEIVIEPFAGGAWLERDADGNETRWGKVLAWEPPGRLLLGWQLNSQWRYDADFLTEVELTFAREGAGTLVTLEHRNLERFGADGSKVAEQVGGGWPRFLGEYARYADGEGV